jgi:hypothetical protein
MLRAEVMGVKPAAAGGTVLARAVTRAGAGGTGTATLEVPKPGGCREVRLTAESSERRCTATLRLDSAPLRSGAGTSTCRAF